jgi:hypothetical protein
MVVNNYTNIKKMSKCLSPQIIELKKRPHWTYGIENPSPVLGQAQICGGVKLVNGDLHIVMYITE